MKTLITLITFCIITGLQAQNLNKKADAIEKEGLLLYRLEMASWNGTDIGLAKVNRNEIGGYFSYLDGNRTTFIFLNRAEKPQCIFSISFDESFEEANAKLSTKKRALTEREEEVWNMRVNAWKEIKTNDIFKFYEKMNFNLIPLIHKGRKVVYALTASNENGLLILGNDYLIEFNDNITVKKSSALHQNIIVLEYGKNEEKVVGSIHNHTGSTREYITATDICTMLLYAPLTGWKDHTVVSKKYISIWNNQSKQLLIIKKNAFEKIEEDQKERHEK